MGSDLAMESAAYARNPKPNTAEWRMHGDDQVLAIMKWDWYHGKWDDVWVGNPDLSDEGLIKLLVNNIPPRPAPVRSLVAQVRDVLSNYLDDEYDYLTYASDAIATFIKERETNASN